MGFEALLLQLRSSRVVRENISTGPFAFEMTDPTSALSVNTSAGHLSVHFEGYHPVEVPFQFEQQQKRIGPAALASFAYHVAMIAALLFAIRFSETHPTQQAILPEHPNANIIWLNQPGP